MHRDATDTQVVVTTVSVTGKKFIFTFILMFLFIPLSFLRPLQDASSFVMMAEKSFASPVRAWNHRPPLGWVTPTPLVMDAV